MGVTNVYFSGSALFGCELFVTSFTCVYPLFHVILWKIYFSKRKARLQVCFIVTKKKNSVLR